MKHLIERMKADGKPTGFVEMLYGEFIVNVQECYYLKQHKQKYVKTMPYANALGCLKMLSGFVCGLLSMGYISSDQKSAYIEDLVSEFDL